MPTVHNAQRAPGLRFGDPRVMALLSSIAAFAHVFAGLTNRTLRDHMATRWSSAYSANQATYDLRRLRLKGLIERVEGTNTYRLTRRGRTVAHSSPSSPLAWSCRPSLTSTAAGPRRQHPAP